MTEYTRKPVCIKDNQADLARFIRATAKVEGQIASTKYVLGSRSIHATVFVPVDAVTEWQRMLEAPAAKAKDRKATDPRPPTGCPLANSK